MINTGTLQFEVRGGQKASLEEGGFIRMPARVPHRATCTSRTECMIFLDSSDIFDILLVDDRWNVTRSWSAADAHKTQSTTSSR